MLFDGFLVVILFDTFAHFFGQKKNVSVGWKQLYDATMTPQNVPKHNKYGSIVRIFCYGLHNFEIKEAM